MSCSLDLRPLTDRESNRRVNKKGKKEGVSTNVPHVVYEHYLRRLRKILSCVEMEVAVAAECRRNAFTYERLVSASFRMVSVPVNPRRKDVSRDSRNPGISGFARVSLFSSLHQFHVTNSLIPLWEMRA